MFQFSQHIYISTISDFTRPIKIKIQPGTYGAKPYYDGYVLAHEEYSPDLRHIVKVLNNRDGDPGMSGTYHDGNTRDPGVLRLVNNYIKLHLPLDIITQLRGWWQDDGYEFYEDNSDDTDDGGYNSDERTNNQDPNTNFKITKLGDYHNLPIIFYLTRKVQDTTELTMELLSEESYYWVWNVKHFPYGIIGLAIQQDEFVNMMGDQMGLASFSKNGRVAGSTVEVNAFANFDAYAIIRNGPLADADVFYPNFPSIHIIEEIEDAEY